MEEKGCITIIAILITILGIIISLFVPEVRKFLDIEKNNTNKKNIEITTFGRFPEASDRLLTTLDVENLSKEDLRIMRNEIFARHGHIFKKEDMKKYFQSQDWYIPKYEDVSSLLTNIERENIKLIIRYE